MFRTEGQRAAVCETLGRLAGRPGLWTTGGQRVPGPTDRAIALLKQRGGGMAPGEWLMIRAAWDVWNGRGRMRLGEALQTLDGRNLHALGALLAALADGVVAIDAWLLAYALPRAAPGSGTATR